MDAPRYGTVDTEYAMRLATTPAEDDGPVWMVNLMKYRDVADYADGRNDNTTNNTATISGREADDLYAPIGPLTAIGAEVVFVGDVDQQLLGDAPVWDRVGVVKYPTRRSFVEMQQRDDFQRLHDHKDAGMEQTIVIGCRPMDGPGVPDGVEQLDWADVPHPPTDDDGPVMVLHVIRFEDAAVADATPDDTPADTPDDMEAYTAHAAVVAARHGARIGGWFAAEGTIVGDGRTWHQARFNAFPSKRAFMEVVMDPSRLEAQRQHREAAIADTYTMILRPTIDQLTPT